jgi:DNA adenine methylase
MGGKQTLAALILALMPPHKHYVEPYVGGGAVFWSKPPSAVETINDTSGELINFYYVAKTQFEALQKEIQSCPHSRALYKQAKKIYDAPDGNDPVKRAWAFWYITNSSYANAIRNGGWGYDLDGSCAIKMANKRDNFRYDYCRRLDKVYIECNDAIKIIKSRDTPDTFFYLDPPYPDSDQRSYLHKYSQHDFEGLLDVLTGIKGKFLLSSYPNKALEKYHWNSRSLELQLCINTNNKNGDKKKIEVLTGNYEFPGNELFTEADRCG